MDHPDNDWANNCIEEKGNDKRSILVPLYQRVGIICKRAASYSIASCPAALIRISGFPLYISIRPVILMCFPSMSESIGDFDTGDARGIQPVKVWLGYAGPMFRNVLPVLLVKTLAKCNLPEAID